jgi:hypothetical protein
MSKMGYSWKDCRNLLVEHDVMLISADLDEMLMA